MSDLNIGTLTGRIELQDGMSTALMMLRGKVGSVQEAFNGLDWNAKGLGIAIAATGVAVVGAVVGIGAAIVGMVEKGDKITGVENAFDKFGVSIDPLSKALKGTVHEMDLMSIMNRALGSGVKLTADDMSAIGQTAREMGKAFGTSAESGVETMTSALTTGNMRALKRLGIQVDVTAAEDKFAKSIGHTRDQLDAAGILEAKRIGMLDAIKVHNLALGDSEVTLSEKFRQSKVAVEEWFDKLYVAVSKSTAVSSAFDKIKNAVERAFGMSSQQLLTKAIDWVDRFATAVGHYGPIVIQGLVDIKNWIVNVWDAVVKAWDTVPDWFKRIATEAGLAAVVIGGTKVAVQGLSGQDTLSALGNLAQIWSVINTHVGKAVKFMKEWALLINFAGWEGFAAGARVAMAPLMAFAAANPVTAVATAVAGIVIAFKELNGITWSNTFLTMLDEIGEISNLGTVGPRSYGRMLARKYVDDNPPPLPSRGRVGMATLVGDSSGEGSSDEKFLKDRLAELRTEGDKLVRHFNDMNAVGRMTDTTFASMASAFDGLAGKYNDLNKEAPEAIRDMQHVLSWVSALKPLDEITKTNTDAFYTEMRSRGEAARRFVVQMTEDQVYANAEIVANDRDTQDKIAELSMTGAAKQIWDIRRVLAVDVEAIQNKKYLSDDQQNHEIDNAMKVADAQIKQIERVKDTWQTRLLGISGALNRVFANINSTAGQVVQIVTGLFQTLKDNAVTLVESAGAILGNPDAIASIAQKTANKIVAIYSAAAEVVSQLFGSTSGGKFASGVLGGAAGGAGIGFLFGAPGVGAAIGGGVALIGGIINLIGGAAKKAREANQAATSQILDLQKNLLATYGTLYDIKVLGDAVGVQLAEAWGDRSQVGLAHFQTMMDEFTRKVKLLQDTMQQYGLTWKDLGKSMQMQTFANNAGTLLDQFNVLINSGVNVDKVIKGMSPALSQFVVDAMDTGQKIPVALQPILQKMIDLGYLTDEAARKLLGLSMDGVPAFKDVMDAAERYGLTLDDLGSKVNQLSINEQAAQLVSDFNLFGKAGVNSEKVLQGMSKHVQDMIDNAAKFGISLPETMRPIVEAMLKAGMLTDSAGNKLANLDSISFAPDLTKATVDLTAAIKDLIVAIRGEHGSADRDDRGIAPRYRGESFSGGGGAGRGGTAVLNLDGRTVAEVAVPHIPGVVQSYGLGIR